jgi:hypothetical protein
MKWEAGAISRQWSQNDVRGSDFAPIVALVHHISRKLTTHNAGYAMT